MKHNEILYAMAVAQTHCSAMVTFLLSLKNTNTAKVNIGMTKNSPPHRWWNDFEGKGAKIAYHTKCKNF